MLAAYTATVQTVDWTILGGGVALATWLAWRAWRRRGVVRTIRYWPPRIGLVDAFLVVIVFLLADLVTTAFISTQVPATATSQPGSSGWHFFVFHDFAGKLMGIALCSALLLRRREWSGPADASISAAVSAGMRPASQDHRTGGGRAVRHGLLAALVLSPPVLGIAWLLELAWRAYWPDQPPPTHDLLRAMHRSEWGWIGVVQIAASAVIISPIAEELFFRGVLLAGLIRATNAGSGDAPANPAIWPGIVLSAIAFGLVHFQVPQSVLPLMLFGAGLSWLHVWSGSLLPCIVAHAAFNARTIVLALLAPELLQDA